MSAIGKWLCSLARIPKIIESPVTQSPDFGAGVAAWLAPIEGEAVGVERTTRDVSIFGDLIHCGYDFPWFPWSAFPFGAETSHHDYHHSSNIGSYGVFSTFFDTICRTNKHYIKSIIEKDKKT